jgi:hypothetical protein
MDDLLHEGKSQSESVFGWGGVTAASEPLRELGR